MRKYLSALLIFFAVSGVLPARADDCVGNTNPQSACNRPDNVTDSGEKSKISGAETAILAAGVVAVAGMFIWYKTDWFRFGAAPTGGGMDFRFRHKF